MKSALLINISDIGDIVSSSVVLDSLKEQSYKVSFLMPQFVHGLWDTDPEVELVCSKSIPNKQYDLIVDLTSDKNSRRLTRQIQAKAKIGRVKGTWQKVRHWVTYSQMVPKKLDGHIVNDYYPVLEAIKDNNKRGPTLSAQACWPEKLNLSESDRVVSFHFGAHNSKRVIPEALLTHVIKHLDSQGYKILLIGSEEEIAKEIIAKNNNIPIYQKMTLSEVKRALKCSKLFVGADSGILHISAALGVNSIGVYGPNVPSRSGPKSPTVSFFEQPLECRPCNQNVECPIKTQCMVTLDKDKFLELILSKLN